MRFLMARRSKDKNLELALKFRDYLLFELMGDNMGKKPEHAIPESAATFAEKKAFLDTMLKAAEQGRKSSEDEEPESMLDTIKKGLQKNGSGTSGSIGNPWGTKSSSDESRDNSSENPSTS